MDSTTSPPGASSTRNVMLEYLLCFAYGVEISASPSNWGIVVGLCVGMANAGRTVKHTEKLDAFPSQHGKELSSSTLPHLDSTDGAKWR